MLKPEQVPDEAVEALIAALHGKPGLPYREAIAAALNAWPEMERERIGDGCEWPLTEEFTDQIILPLAAPSGALTEASDDPQKG